jgi:hypothetical protein
MKRMLIGYGISVVLGLALGLGIASNKFLEQTIGGLLVSLQSLPSICWLPIAVLWFGLTEKAILFVVVMGSLLSVTISMETGRKQLPKIYTMAGRNRSSFVLARYITGEPSIYRDRTEARLGICLALVDLGRNDFRHSWIGSAADDGPRSE